MGLNVYLERPLFDRNGEHVMDQELHNAGFTHNLTKMAEAVGLYQPLWRGEAERASELVEDLETGISLMKIGGTALKRYDADNGWGTYEQFLEGLEKLLKACHETPDAELTFCR